MNKIIKIVANLVMITASLLCVNSYNNVIKYYDRLQAQSENFDRLKGVVAITQNGLPASDLKVHSEKLKEIDYHNHMFNALEVPKTIEPTLWTFMISFLFLMITPVVADRLIKKYNNLRRTTTE